MSGAVPEAGNGNATLNHSAHEYFAANAFNRRLNSAWQMLAGSTVCSLMNSFNSISNSSSARSAMSPPPRQRRASSHFSCYFTRQCPSAFVADCRSKLSTRSLIAFSFLPFGLPGMMAPLIV